MIRLESLRALIAFGVQNDLLIHQIDVTTAFLNGELEEEVYMKQPEGFIRGEKQFVCKLKKSIYGLKQSPRSWNSVLDGQFKQMSFIQCESDPCIYRACEGGVFIIGVYVDDIILAAETEKRLNDVKLVLAKRFDFKDMGKLHYL